MKGLAVRAVACLGLVAVPTISKAQAVTYDSVAVLGAAQSADTSHHLTAPDVQLTSTAKACGAQRVCVSGYDLRVLGVTVPDSVLGISTLAVATVSLDNRGRSASPASEMVVDFDGKNAVRVDLPSFPSGARASVRVPLQVPQHPDQNTHVRAVLDPESIPGDKRSDNNETRSAGLRLEMAQFAWQKLTAPDTAQPNRFITLHATVKNASRAAITPAATVVIYNINYAPTQSCGGKSAAFDVPPLVPGGMVSFIAHLHTGNGDSNCRGQMYQVQIDATNDIGNGLYRKDSRVDFWVPPTR